MSLSPSMLLTLRLHGLIFLFLIPLKKIQIIFKTNEGNRSCQLKRAEGNRDSNQKAINVFFPVFLQLLGYFNTLISTPATLRISTTILSNTNSIPEEAFCPMNSSLGLSEGSQKHSSRKKCLLDTTVIFVKSILLVDHSWRSFYMLYFALMILLPRISHIKFILSQFVPYFPTE